MKSWMGSKFCDLCTTSLSSAGPWFADAKMKRGGWALMCCSCFQEHGIKFGLGWGQKYDSQTFVKIKDQSEVTTD